MQRSWRTLLPLIVLAVVVGYIYTHRHPSDMGSPSTTATSGQAAASATAISHPAQLPAYLTPEARTTLALIANGGPFPYRQNGEVFGNYEHRLPEEPRGYYHEYTVPTPRARNRGARRIVTGGNPPAVYYYTNDHYRSFRQFTVPR